MEFVDYIRSIMKDFFQFVVYIGVYSVIFFTLEIVPFETDMNIATILGLVAMVSVFLVLVLGKVTNFNRGRFLLTNLIFTFLFCAITVIYDETVGLTEVAVTDSSIVFRNSFFYEATLSINHSIIISAVILFLYSLVLWKKKPVALSILNILILVGYLFVVV